MPRQNPPLNEEQMHIEGVRRIRAACQRICDLVDLGAPPMILCNEIVSLFRRGTGYFPSDMERAFGRFLHDTGRSYVGGCHYCGAQAVQDNLCETCNARIAAEAFRMEMETSEDCEENEEEDDKP